MCRWGIAHEEYARKRYSAEMTLAHRDFSISSCGLFVAPKYPHLGASPDAYVTCSCCGLGVLEIKCPFPESLNSVLGHFHESLEKCDISSTVKLRRNHKYYYQVQAQILLCGVEYCDYVVCTPDTEKSMHIERIYSDTEFLKSALEKSAIFYKSRVLPELVVKLLYTRYMVPASEPEKSHANKGVQFTVVDTHDVASFPRNDASEYARKHCHRGLQCASVSKQHVR